MPSDGATRRRLNETYDQTQARFHGTDAVPILWEVRPDDVMNLLLQARTTDSVSRAAKELLERMDNATWCITAGAHLGGLGGAMGGQDPEQHISLNVGGQGFHLRVSPSVRKPHAYFIWDITGPDIVPTRGRAAREARDGPGRVSRVEDWARLYSLSDQEAAKAIRHQRQERCTAPAACAWVIGNRRRG